MNRIEPTMPPETRLPRLHWAARAAPASMGLLVDQVRRRLASRVSFGFCAVTRGRIVVHFCLGVCAIVIGALILATVAREVRLVRAGDKGEAYPLPFHGVMFTELADGPRIPGNDFSQVYASATSLRTGGSAYHPANWRGGRPNYPPLTNWLYVPVSKFRFETAILVQHGLSFFALGGATIFVLWKLGLRRHIVRVLMAQACLYFLTPVGLTHIERGQFDLLVGAAVLLGYACAFLPGNRFGTAALSGFLGAIKWSAPIFLGSFAWLAFLLCRGKKRWTFFLIPAVTLLATLPFWRELKDYWVSIQHWELNTGPSGLTFQHYLPRTLTRALPLLVPTVLAALVWARRRTRMVRGRVFLSLSFPAAVSLLILAVCFGTMSFEYRTVVFMAMIPALVLWIEREPWVSIPIKALTAVCFGLMLPLTFRVFGLHHEHDFGSNQMTKIYAAFGALFFLESLAIAAFVRPSS